MTGWPDEFPLAAAVAINLFVLLSCWRLARRTCDGDVVQRILDALLITYLVQYIAVGVAGILGVLDFGSMVVVAIILCAPMWLIGRARLLPSRKNPHPGPLPEYRESQRSSASLWILAGCAIFVIGEVAAFFVTCVVGIVRNSPWRVGASLGLLLSVKFTALLSLPVLLLLIDLPIRARWRARDWSIVVGSALLLAGPWYGRNLLLTDNPIYPMQLPGLPGMFATARSVELTSWNGLWTVFVGGYYSTTVWLATVLVAAWIAAAVLRWRDVKADTIVRLCIVGPPVQIALFILLSPYPEIRFVYPSLLLLFACAAIVVRTPAIGAIVALAGVATGFIPHNLQRVIPPAMIACAASLAGWWVLARFISELNRRIALTATILLLAIAGLVYVFWEAYLRRPIDGYVAMCVPAWRVAGYGSLAEAWEFVRSLPGDVPIAYTNTHFVYPLMGFDLRRRVVYVPTRRGLRAWTDLPPFDEPLSGEAIGTAVTAALQVDTDSRQWIEAIIESKATHLFVAKALNPSELQLVREFATRFSPVFENDAAAVFEIRR